MRTLAELLRWAELAPEGTTIPAHALAELLTEVEVEPDLPSEAVPSSGEPETWRERLWRVPTETRLGVEDVAEAVNRSKHWVYRATGRKTDPLPSRKLDGRIEVTAGELRAWIRDHEEVQSAGPYLSAERGIGGGGQG